MSAVRHLQAEPERIRQTSWKEYGTRFLFGGVITAVVGILGKAFGPAVAGLFLAFPAILPASLTLAASHENERSAGGQAVGAAIGSVGLLAFGAVVWTIAPRTAAWLVLIAATAAWFALAVAVWGLLVWVRQHRRAG
ncbi:MAG: DUF3147 family protein [Chloroflexi bacterium]|nr:DUF3147 family protein [Chloroflexota bacterium]